MLDVNDFITQRGGNPDRIRESQRRRGASVELVDKVIALWEEARAGKSDMHLACIHSLLNLAPAQYAVARIGTEINSLQKQIGLKKKAKDDASELLQKKATVEQNKKAQEIIAAEKQAALRALVKTVGNYVADSVPVSQNEDDNETIRTWAPEGFDEKRKPGLSHHEVLQRLDGYDPIRGVKLVGHRGYCLTGYGLFLFVPPACLMVLDSDRVLGIWHSSTTASSFSFKEVRTIFHFHSSADIFQTTPRTNRHSFSTTNKWPRLPNFPNSTRSCTVCPKVPTRTTT